MNSSYSSESTSSLLAESTSSNATSTCCEHAINEMEEDRWLNNIVSSSSESTNRPRSKSVADSIGRKCQTTFSRTTGTADVNSFGQTFPNCGTYFFKHISDGEEDVLDGSVSCIAEEDPNCNGILLPSSQGSAIDENEIYQNQIPSSILLSKEIDTLSPRSEDSVSVERLVMEVEDLVVFRRSSKMCRTSPIFKGLGNFGDSTGDLLFCNGTDDDGMDCAKDDIRRSLQSSSSLSMLMECMKSNPDEKMYNQTSSDNDSDIIATTQGKMNRKRLFMNKRKSARNEDEMSSCYTDEDVRVPRRDKHVEEEELSDFWDQEKYLSEHNYDEPIDEDSTLKLLNFGDDYSKFIDSMSEGDLLEHKMAGATGMSSTPNAKQKLKRRLKRSTTVRESYDSVSESELDDAWKVALGSRTKLTEIKHLFKEIQEETYVLDPNSVNRKLNVLISLKNTCLENVDCILKLLDEKPQNSCAIILKKTKRSFTGLLKHWQEMFYLVEKQFNISEKLSKLILDIQTLESDLTEILKVDIETPTAKLVIHNKFDLENDVQILRASSQKMVKLKSDLFCANLGLHNFWAELITSTRGDKVKDEEDEKCQELTGAEMLRDKISELYLLWDSVYQKVNSQMINAESTMAKLEEFEIEKQRLTKIRENPKIRQANIRKQIYRKKSLSLTEDSGISESGDNDNEELILTKMRRLVQDLEEKLTPDSCLIKEISESLKISAVDFETAHLEAINAAMNDLEISVKSKPQKKRRTKSARKPKTSSGPKSRSFFWRLFWSAFPFHMMFMAAIFFTWLYQPRSCDQYSFFSLVPKLTFPNGPPPI